MFSFFKKKSESVTPIITKPIVADMHSHVLPGLDDGSPDVETSVQLVKGLQDLGYKKLICTPHVMSDYYKNTPETIKAAAERLTTALVEQEIDMRIEIGAEYYLDEVFMEQIENKKPLLSFGDEYLLFETSFMNPSVLMNQTIFLLQSMGYKPVLAHPERYVYMFGKYEKLVELHEKGVLLQINLNSLSGYYSKESKKVAERLIDDQLISFVGTDCHHKQHLNMLSKSRENPYYAKALDLPLLNDSL